MWGNHENGCDNTSCVQCLLAQTPYFGENTLKSLVNFDKNSIQTQSFL